MEDIEVECCLLNVQGLIGKGYNKLGSDEMKTMFNKNDIVLLTETWSNDNFNYDIQNFTLFKLHRHNIVKGSKRSSGGVMIHVKNLSRHVEFLKISSDCVLWLKLDVSSTVTRYIFNKQKYAIANIVLTFYTIDIFPALFVQ